MEAIIAAAEEVDIGAIVPDENERGAIFAHFTDDERVDMLQDSLNPIREALVNLDAERYLNFTRIRDDGDSDSGNTNRDATVLIEDER